MTDVRLTATNPEDSSVVPVACNDKGELKLEEPIKFDGNLDGNLDITGGLKAGTTSGQGYIEVVGDGSDYGYIFGINTNEYRAGLNFKDQDGNGAAFIAGDADGKDLAKIDWFGGITAVSSTFSGKAGFTKEGYLWCTTRRGNTVILDATSNGLGTWADYTPPTRRDQAKDKLEALRDESNTISQDLPET